MSKKMLSSHCQSVCFCYFCNVKYSHTICMKIAYTRVSTYYKNLDLQPTALRDVGCKERGDIPGEGVGGEAVLGTGMQSAVTPYW